VNLLKPTVLVLYYAKNSPLRTTVADHLFAISRYGRCRTIYLNVAVRSVPRWIGRLGLDLIVFHTTLLSQRWHEPTFRGLSKRLASLRTSTAEKVAIPQDEFLRTRQLSEFISAFGIGHVLTCASEADWDTIYQGVPRDRVSFQTVLTGYLDPKTLARIERLSAKGPRDRPMDVAYRAGRPEFWLGRHARLKASIADAFERAAPEFGLATDISTRESDTLVGDDWYRFLLQARWTIGVEGGASIVDTDGSLRDRTQQYVRRYPNASFEEVEAACFPGLEGSLGLMTLSPRHLEACATRTAQVLVEGEYNGILEPNVHYLPLKRDLSNLEDVCVRMRDETLRRGIVERAYEDVVASRAYEYQRFADLIVSLAGRPSTVPLGATARLLFRWESSQDRISWIWVAVRQRVRGAIRDFLDWIGLLPRVQRLRGMNVETRG